MPDERYHCGVGGLFNSIPQLLYGLTQSPYKDRERLFVVCSPELSCAGIAMSVYSIVQYVVFLVVVTVFVRPLGGYMPRVFAREKTVLDPLGVPVERWLYRLTGVDPTVEMGARQYATSFVSFRPRLYALPLRYPSIATLPSLVFTAILHYPTLAGPVLQHSDQFFNHLNMAGLCGRRHHELLQSDGGPLHAELSKSAQALLQRNLLIYGVGGIIVPFLGIKAIDVVLTTLHLA
jgi:hypothetical protein